MDTTRMLEQVTEWAPPNETVEVVDFGSSQMAGMPVRMRRVRYVEWCQAEAKRLHGRVKKETRPHAGEDGAVVRQAVVAVFA